MRQEWSPEENFSNRLKPSRVASLLFATRSQSPSTRVQFANSFFELAGRFPDVLEEVPPAAVEYVADLVTVPATDFAKVHAGLTVR